MDRAARRRLLGGVAYPSDTDRILVDLMGAGAPPDLLSAVQRLDDRIYDDTDDLERALDALASDGGEGPSGSPQQ